MNFTYDSIKEFITGYFRLKFHNHEDRKKISNSVDKNVKAQIYYYIHGNYLVVNGYEEYMNVYKNILEAGFHETVHLEDLMIDEKRGAYGALTKLETINIKTKETFNCYEYIFGEVCLGENNNINMKSFYVFNSDVAGTKKFFKLDETTESLTSSA